MENENKTENRFLKTGIDMLAIVFPTADEKWVYCYDDAEGRNQHSEPFSTEEEATQAYFKLPFPEGTPERVGYEFGLKHFYNGQIKKQESIIEDLHSQITELKLLVYVDPKKEHEAEQLHQDSAELRSLKQSILESGIMKHAPNREMSFHDRLVFAISNVMEGHKK